MKEAFSSKKNYGIFYTLLLLFTSFLVAPQEAKAGRDALAITGVALGATALGVVGYNLYRQRNQRRNYYDSGYYNRTSYYQPVRSSCNRRAPVRYYNQPRYSNTNYYDNYSDRDYYYY